MITEFDIKIKITDIGANGEGIGKVDGLAVFVFPGEAEDSPNKPIIGDVVLVEITKVKKNYVVAKMKRLVAPSEYRREPFCEYAGVCGGCPLQEMSYEGQIKLKDKQVRDRLIRIAGIESPKVNKIIGMEDSFRYRNKAQMPVARDAVGFFKADSNEVVNCNRCLVSAKPMEAVAEALRKFIHSNNMTAYDRKTGKGLIRHLVVRAAHGTGEVMAILVINGKRLPDYQKLIGMMDGAVNELPPYGEGKKYSLESVIFNFNTKNTSEILGERCVTAAGKPTIEDTIGSMRFEISPLSFYQVNPVQMKKLYDKVLEYSQLTGNETVLDVYCGIGTIGLFCARAAKKVIGIESLKSAIFDANRNAAINAVTNVEYMHGQAEEILPKLAGEGFFADVVILDPPRAGCKPKLLEAVCKVAPKRIVYISCNTATLARDVKLLMEMGYRFEEAAPVDMFPWTAHVECVVLMAR